MILGRLLTYLNISVIIASYLKQQFLEFYTITTITPNNLYIHLITSLPITSYKLKAKFLCLY